MKVLYFFFLLLLVSASGLGQSAKDSSQADPGLISSYRGLFDKVWCRKFTELWNANPETAKALGGMGQVHFVSIDADTMAVLMNFDSLGRASVLNVEKSFPADTIPTFSAKLEKWAEFMEGKFNAVSGVLTKKIVYKGPFTLAIKYGFQFNKVAPVGKRISLSQNVKKGN